jgi:hypothetical protein
LDIRISILLDAPWPANKDELIDYAIRAGAPLEVVENLQSIEDEGEIYESMEEIWITLLQTKTIFGMRMNIKYIIKEKVSKRLFFG